MLYLNVADLLENKQDHDLTIFYVLKKGIQRAGILMSYLKSEEQPPKNILPKCTTQNWSDFLQGEYFDNFFPYIIDDLVKMRKRFEKKYEIVKKVYVTYNPAYEKIINDNFNLEVSKHVAVYTKLSIKKLSQNLNPDNINVCIYIIMLDKISMDDSIETNAFMTDIRKKVEAILTHEEKNKIILINRFASN